MKQKRNATRQVKVGGVMIGGGAPVTIQSMTSLPIENVEATICQVNNLAEQGAAIVRLAVRTMSAIPYLKKIIKNVAVPLAADIHFDYRLAVEAIKSGIAKVRINPGNIGDENKVKEVIRAAREHGIPLRVGVNGGSINKKIYSEVNAENLVRSALDQVKVLEDNDFTDIVVSIKSSDIQLTIQANRLFAEQHDYPLHIGLTEAGYGLHCIAYSSVAIGHLLLSGIGDTVRVSMTGDPLEEVAVAKKILEAAGERRPSLRLIACPTCGRTDQSLDLRELAQMVEESLLRVFSEELDKLGRTMVVAVMGCEVNGPGEAAHADFGLAGAGKGKMILFARGEKLCLLDAAEALDRLIEVISDYFEQR